MKEEEQEEEEEEQQEQELGSLLEPEATASAKNIVFYK